MNIIMIVLSCVLSNHMGLIEAIEEKIGHKLIIIDCSKCFTFWSVTIYMLIVVREPILSFFTGFCCAYIALWVELLLGYINILYNKLWARYYTLDRQDQSIDLSQESPARNADNDEIQRNGGDRQESGSNQ